jgi:N-acetylglucosaminyldiphosphoundecaprenol N-acetyl-beta-D-mannosaminyltransferase
MQAYLCGQIQKRKSATIVGHNLHSAYIHQVNSQFRNLYERADIILADGFPIQKLANREAKLIGAKKTERLGSTDWVPRLVANLNFKRIAVVGSTDESNKKTCEILKKLSPSSQTRSIPLSEYDETKARMAATELHRFDPELTLVGLGMPLQEHFISSHLADLGGIIAAVGGAIDQLSGVQKNAPRWIGKVGFEWLWRLLSNPSRLWHRYLVEPIKLTRLIYERSKKN